MLKRKLSVFLIIYLCLNLSFSSAYGEEDFASDDEIDLKIPILTYHHFVEGSPPQGKEGAIISIALFKEQLLYLQENGFHAISLTQLKDYLIHGAELPPNPFVITIDDGYQSNYTLAYPVLLQLDMPANINIVVSSRGLTPGLYPHFSWDEAREMLDSGLIEFGSHTYDLHNPNIRQLPNEGALDYMKRVFEDFKLSRDLMKEHLGIEPYIYCSPYGIYNNMTQSIIQSLGFQLHLTIRSGVVSKTSNILELERINVRGDDTPEGLLEKIAYHTASSTVAVGEEKPRKNSHSDIPFLSLSHVIINPLQYIDSLLKIAP